MSEYIEGMRTKGGGVRRAREEDIRDVNLVTRVEIDFADDQICLRSRKPSKHFCFGIKEQESQGESVDATIPFLVKTSLVKKRGDYYYIGMIPEGEEPAALKFHKGILDIAKKAKKIDRKMWY